jgi:hypothetical protein
MPADDVETDAARPARQSVGATVLAGLEGLEKWLQLLRKVAISLAVVVGIFIAIVVIGRSVYQEGIVIDPVIVQLADAKDGPTPELAALMIAKHIDAVQRAGLREWRKLYVDQTPNRIDLQVPGSPFTLRGGMREVGTLFGVNPPNVRASIVSRAVGSALVASVSVDGDPGARGPCEEDASAAGVDRLVNCIALNAMSVIDPKMVASYVFHDEERLCVDVDAGQPPEAKGDPVLREEKRIANRRAFCGFRKTQALIAEILKRGRAEDLPWVPYIYGRVHMARATALAGIDREEQLAELDQAIGRFADSQQRIPNSTSAIAILFEAYVKKGITIHEATRGLKWSDDPDSPMQWRLYLAESTFADAVRQLMRIPTRRDGTLDALVLRIEGSLYYRQWMIKAHRRTRSDSLAVAIGQPEELALLKHAAARYEASAKNATPITLFMDWGNVLRASGDFEGAASKYRLAADRLPGSWEPRINLVIAYLDRVIHGRSPAEPVQVLVALGAASNYLSWVSGGDPTPNLRVKVEAVLEKTGVPEDLKAFQSCYETAVADGDQRSRSLAGRKHCLDRAIQGVNNRVIGASRPPVKASAK